MAKSKFKNGEIAKYMGSRFPERWGWRVRVINRGVSHVYGVTFLKDKKYHDCWEKYLKKIL